MNTLTLDVHAQRGLQYLLCVSVCLSVCHVEYSALSLAILCTLTTLTLCKDLELWGVHWAIIVV